MFLGPEAFKGWGRESMAQAARSLEPAFAGYTSQPSSQPRFGKLRTGLSRNGGKALRTQ